ncbi:probable phytol kinase 2, chloroplastic [Selaginella moellendorffii]|nr:probable phytol kinase 2, chloroplastic [Selaginella moellendorffii]|eukprot:XP_002971473.2 probable phytol kinase 2, chloroplastic [Selaginella moellendorffii]
MAASASQLALFALHARDQGFGVRRESPIPRILDKSRVSASVVSVRHDLVFSTRRSSGSCAGFGLLQNMGSVAPLPQQHQLGYDLLMSAVTLSGALGSLRFFDELAKRDVFDKKLSRKLVHICVGLIFMLFWPLFSDAPRARYLAAIAPLTNALRMVAFGTGLLENKAFVKAVSRDGHPRELLKGPLYYAITISIATLFFWRNSPCGVVTIANLCAGDGFADIFGRKYGRWKLPYNPNKSLQGSVAMFVMSAAFSMLYTFLFSQLGYFDMGVRTIIGIVAVSLATTVVESLPISSALDDNLTVPATAMAVGLLTL